MSKFISQFITCLILAVFVTSCSVSYSFNGASVDYTKIKSIDIRDFQNQATRVYPPLTQVLNEELRDTYTRNTKLIVLNNKPADLELEGEVVRYDLTPLDVQADAFAAQTRLTLAVRIRYINNVNPSEDKEETFSTYQDFNSDILLDNIQDELIGVMVKDIVNQVFNATLSNW